MTARVGWNIEALRRWRRLTLKDLSARLGAAGCPIPVSTLSRIENGTGRIDPELLVALAWEFDVSVPALLAPTSAEVEGHTGRPSFQVQTGVTADGEPVTRGIGDYGRAIGLEDLHWIAAGKSSGQPYRPLPVTPAPDTQEPLRDELARLMERITEVEGRLNGE